MKTKTDKLRLSIFLNHFPRLFVYREIFTDKYNPSGYFPRTALWADCVSSRMNTIASSTQLKPIKIGENRMRAVPVEVIGNEKSLRPYYKREGVVSS